MRPDLAKCTTECYRRGAGSLEHTYKIKFGGKVKIDPDPEHEYDNERGGFHSSARHRHKESKDFGDKLGALRGNLRANLGRKWDDVFSEFCKNLDRRSLNGWHIWTHLKQEITINTFMQDDKVCEISSYYPRGAREVTGFYVHPETGRIEYKPWETWRTRHRNRAEEQETTKINLSDGSHYEKIDGLWFSLEKHGMKEQFFWEYGTHLSVPHVVKRSCNRKEIAWIKAQLGV